MPTDDQHLLYLVVVWGPLSWAARAEYQEHHLEARGRKGK